MSSTNPHTDAKLKAANTYAPKSGALGDANQDFHESYNQLVAEHLKQLGHEVPVIVMTDHLNLLIDGTKQSELVIPDRYHELKAISHVAFGLQLTLMDNGEGPLSDATASRLRDKLARIQGASDGFPDDLPDKALQSLKAVLDQSKTMIDSVLAASSVSNDSVIEYARNVAPYLLKNAGFAVRLELDAMHKTTTAWREQIGESRWNQLYVVITGGHQPRYRDASKQYFQKLLHEKASPDAEFENRVLYGEGVRDFDSALDMLARHMIDQDASAMFFGSRNRLQEDLLADVATEYLKVLLPRD